MNWQFRYGTLMLGMLWTGFAVNGQTVNQQEPAADTIFAAPPLQRTVLNTQAIKPKKPKPILRELSGGIRLNTDGWSLFVDKGWVKTDDEKNSDKFYDIRLAQVELNEHKHPKEIRLTNTDYFGNYTDKPKPYIYGKINNFYALKFGYGKRKMIAGKPEQGTVSIHWVYLGGLSAGLLKPYYLDAYVPQDNPGNLVRKSIRYSEETKQAFLSQRYIVGSSGWSTGLGEIKVIPGLHGKTGLHFDFAATHKTKLALEVGISGELYTQGIELMANQKALPYLFSGYVSLQFGKRY